MGIITKEEFRKLLQRHLAGEASPQEQALLDRYYDLFELKLDALDTMPAPEKEALYRRLESRLFAADGTPIAVQSQPVRIHRPAHPWRRRWLPYAAAILFALGVILYLQVFRSGDPRDGLLSSQTETPFIPPGTNRATLTLADGRLLELSTEQEGIVVGDGIVYNDGQVVIRGEQNAPTTPERYRLTIPQGGTYQVTLPDGSRVWLNAASTLSYPSHFTPGEDRIVELEGEAYFEIVARQGKTTRQRLPFLVKTGGQTVEVLGTAFNVNAYLDESGIQTTLVEGKVRVHVSGQSEPVALHPGEQAVVQADQAVVRTVDTENYTGWREGWISFQDKPLPTILRELARWYRIEIEYQGSLPDEVGYGMLRRTDDLSAALRLLESGGIRYRMEGRTLVIL